MSVKLLTEPQLECLSLIGGCRGSSESTLVKLSNCWNSHAAAQFFLKESFMPKHHYVVSVLHVPDTFNLS